MKKQNYLFYLLSGLLMCAALASCGNSSGANDYGIPDTASGQTFLYTVNYTLYDDDFHAIARQINTQVLSVDGFVYSSDEDSNTGYFVYKIPSEKLNSFISYVDSFDGIGSKKISSQTVTSPENNIQTKIEAKESRKASLISLIADESLPESEKTLYRNELATINQELDALYSEKAENEAKTRYSMVIMSFFKSAKSEKEIYWSNYFSYLRGIAKNLGTVFLCSAPFACVAGIGVGVAAIITKKKKKQ